MPISASVQSPSFTVEKKHMLLAINNTLIPTSSAYLEFSGGSAVAAFGAYFGKNIPEYAEVQKYFGYLSKQEPARTSWLLRAGTKKPQPRLSKEHHLLQSFQN